MPTFKMKCSRFALLMPLWVITTLAITPRCVKCAPIAGTPRVIKTFVPKSEIYAFMPSPKSESVAVLSGSGESQQLSLLTSISGAEIWSQPIPDNTTRALDFSHDGQLLVVAGVQVGRGMGERRSYVTNRGSIRLFESQSGRLIRTLTVSRPGYIQSLALSPRATILAVGGNSWIEFWNYATGKVLGSVPVRGEATSLDFSPDGKVLASAALWSGPTLWNVGTRRRISDLPYQGSQTLGVAFSPDSQSLALAGSAFTTLYKVKNLKLLWKNETLYGFHPSYRRPSGSLHISPDQRFVAVSGHTGALLDVKTGMEKYRFKDTAHLKFGTTGRIWGLQAQWDETTAYRPPSIVMW